MSLLDRPGKPSREDDHDVYVAMSRVKRGDGLRFLADPNDLDFLESLKPSINLVAFLSGYDRSTGIRNRSNADRRRQALESVNGSRGESGGRGSGVRAGSGGRRSGGSVIRGGRGGSEVRRWRI